jgi:holliday junction DNA helicase RuvA
MQAEKMVAAIRGNDVASLTKTPGIGKKTAERMVLELRDKLESFGVPAAVAKHSPIEEDVLSALTNLGYQRAAAERALASAGKNGGTSTFDQLFRESLSALAK